MNVQYTKWHYAAESNEFCRYQSSTHTYQGRWENVPRLAKRHNIPYSKMDGAVKTLCAIVIIKLGMISPPNSWKRINKICDDFRWQLTLQSNGISNSQLSPKPLKDFFHKGEAIFQIKNESLFCWHRAIHFWFLYTLDLHHVFYQNFIYLSLSFLHHRCNLSRFHGVNHKYFVIFKNFAKILSIFKKVSPLTDIDIISSYNS